MIFDDFCQKFQKNDFFDETLGFFDLFEELEAHTRGEKNIPLPILYHFPPSKGQNDLKKKFFGPF